MIREVVDLNRISFEINLFAVLENDSKNIIFYNIFQMLVKKGTDFSVALQQSAKSSFSAIHTYFCGQRSNIPQKC